MLVREGIYTVYALGGVRCDTIVQEEILPLFQDTSSITKTTTVVFGLFEPNRLDNIKYNYI